MQHLDAELNEDLLQLRHLLFDFVSLNPKFQFYFGVHATKGHVQLYAPLCTWAMPSEVKLGFMHQSLCTQ